MVKGEAVIFFIYSLGFILDFTLDLLFFCYIDDDDEEAYETVVT